MQKKKYRYTYMGESANFYEMCDRNCHENSSFVGEGFPFSFQFLM